MIGERRKPRTVAAVVHRKVIALVISTIGDISATKADHISHNHAVIAGRARASHAATIVIHARAAHVTIIPAVSFGCSTAHFLIDSIIGAIIS